MTFRSDAEILLDEARERGSQSFGAFVLPPGMEKFGLYAGLISKTMELAKVVQTEHRDLKVIAAHHEIEITRINAAFREVEAAMVSDFKNEQEQRAQTFAAIDKLFAAGQYEIASEFHKRLIDGQKRSALETVLEARNASVGEGGSRLRVR